MSRSKRALRKYGKCSCHFTRLGKVDKACIYSAEQSWKSRKRVETPMGTPGGKHLFPTLKAGVFPRAVAFQRCSEMSIFLHRGGRAGCPGLSGVLPGKETHDQGTARGVLRKGTRTMVYSRERLQMESGVFYIPSVPFCTRVTVWG
ncbi:hypothetical protein HJG60_008536 [Phyllostomus discolor]|uniref:Uncharacterized protein n=1 Tax=Phyllostomus discolor TaxID=89673 RepID=A0A833Z1G1_9CHIR|nr:hypothetical protein HJG60_008536 [Phyllostomus discolor]